MKLHRYVINDNDKPLGQRGSALSNGRAYLTIYSGEERKGNERRVFGIGLNWGFNRRHVFNLHAHIGGEHLVSGTFSLGRVFLHVECETGKYHRRIANFDRRVGVSAHSTFTIFYLLAKDSWNGGKTIRYPILDWLLGRRKYTKRDIKVVEDVALPLFSGATATIRFTESQWKRPRWPFALVRYQSWIDVKRPPAFPGKGENSWDLDDDAIYGMGSSELTVAGVVGDYIKAVLKNRERYGGSLSWAPRAEVKP